MAGDTWRQDNGGKRPGQAGGDQERGKSAGCEMVENGAGHGGAAAQKGMTQGTAYGYVFREPVRMQVLLPGHDPVEVRAYATIDARMQAASILNVDIAEALEAKVAVETAALRRWKKRQK